VSAFLLEGRRITADRTGTPEQSGDATMAERTCLPPLSIWRCRRLVICL